MNYFADKNNRAARAVNHTKQMEKSYGNDIKNSIADTCAYSPANLCAPEIFRNKETVTALVKEDTVSAVMNYSEGRTAVLNFASFKNPGGMFLAGSSAQEESICMESYLYNVLVRFKNTWYKENENRLHGGLYENRALYSPHIMFERDKKVYADVITCACPNKSLIRYGHFNEEDNSQALMSRIDFVFNIALTQKVDTLILGAFGCGVFSQDANEVAQIFEYLLANKYAGAFKKVIFAVPCFSERDANYEAFANVFDK